MRVFMSGFSTETNTFSPLPTGAASFRDGVFRRRNASLDPTAPWSASQRVWRAGFEGAGYEVVESLSAFAQPAGTTVRAAYEDLRDIILADLRDALPVAAVVLFMHGAMVAEGYDDCEGDLLARVRALVGPDVPVGVELDLHCHLTRAMTDAATVIVTYKEYPHTDVAARGAEVLDIVLRTLRGEVRPVMAVHDLNMIGVWRTSLAPMRALIDHMQRIEARPGMLSVSLAHGFPWADVADVGARVLAISDADAELARAAAAEIAQAMWDGRDEMHTPYLDVDAALDAHRDGKAGSRTIFADVADNAGGGAASDSSFILSRLLERGIANAALGYVWDPVAARLCHEAGEGASLALRLCGKLGPASGPPLDLTAKVRGLRLDHTQTGLDGGPNPLGASAWIEVQGIDIVITTDRAQPVSPDGFTGLGVPLQDRSLIVLKSMQHFLGGFAPLADTVLYVTSPGALSPDFAALPLTARKAKWWPRDADAVPTA